MSIIVIFVHVVTIPSGYSIPSVKNHGKTLQGRHKPLFSFLSSPTMGLISPLSDVVQGDPRAHLNKSASFASVSPKSEATTPSGTPVSDRYVDRLLRNAEPLPPITRLNWYKEIRWFNLSVIVITPLVALYGAATTRLDVRTFWFCVFYYVFNMIGEPFYRPLEGELIPLGTLRNHRWYVPWRSISPPCPDTLSSGYHRLWSHRAYNASKPLEYFLAVAGGGSVQGAIWWWARGHRSHHR
jgi:hypothetical protein